MVCSNNNYCFQIQLLQHDPSKRLNTIEALKQESLMADVDWEAVEAVNVQPSFVPPVSCFSHFIGSVQPPLSSLPKIWRVSGCLQEVMANKGWNTGGLLWGEDQTHLLFGENVLHAIFSLQFIILWKKSMLLVWPVDMKGLRYFRGRINGYDLTLSGLSKSC